MLLPFSLPPPPLPAFSSLLHLKNVTKMQELLLDEKGHSIGEEAKQFDDFLLAIKGVFHVSDKITATEVNVSNQEVAREGR